MSQIGGKMQHLKVKDFIVIRCTINLPPPLLFPSWRSSSWHGLKKKRKQKLWFTDLLYLFLNLERQKPQQSHIKQSFPYEATISISFFFFFNWCSIFLRRINLPGRPPPYGDLREKSMCFWESRRTTKDGILTTCFLTL